MGEEKFINFAKIALEEIEMFICIIIFMGICRLPTYELYFKVKDNIFCQSFPSTLLTFNRFKEILKYLHVFDGEKLIEDRKHRDLSPLDYLINYFNNRFSECYTPEKNLSIDESLAKWSGKGGEKCYFPLKSAKKGLKLYSCCESKSGYALKIQLYNGEKIILIDRVKSLLSEYNNLNYHVYFDNFYTSYGLIKELENVGFYCCGTMRDGRGGPKNFKKNITKNTIQLRSKNGVNIFGFYDNAPVCIMSNIHDGRDFLKEDYVFVEEIDRKKERKRRKIPKKEKPFIKTKLCSDYNSNMGGVDLMDQMTTYYSMNKKTQKWTTKITFHLLNIAIHNSYILQRKYSNKDRNYLGYLLTLISYISGKYTKPNPGPNAYLLKNYDEICDLYQKKDDFNDLFGSYENSNQNGHYTRKMEKRLQCHYCKLSSIRKLTQCKCSKCHEPLCVYECFEEFHLNK